MKIKLLLISMIITALSACSSTGKKDEPRLSAAAKSTGYRCEKAIKLGSHIKNRRCSTKMQRDAEREQAQKDLRSNQRSGPKKTDNGGL